MKRQRDFAILPKKAGLHPNEAAFMAACNLLLNGKTREESRLAVRHLLRTASRNLERRG